jgi:hypothetical protein
VSLAISIVSPVVDASMHACSVSVQPGEPGQVSVLAPASGARTNDVKARIDWNEAVLRGIVCNSPVGSVRT